MPPNMDCAIVIPAYNPDAELGRIVEDLLPYRPPAVVVVDDGSTAAAAAHFAALPRGGVVTILRHDENRGKGTAIKTGLAYVLERHPRLAGTVLVDADGQHQAADAAKVAEALARRPGGLVIGTRRFGRGVPLRSRVGNSLTSLAFRALTGTRLGDTQSGLRGVSRDLIPLVLSLPGRRYELEMEMLLLCRSRRIPLVEIPIATIYRGGNCSSHFRPLADSIRIIRSLLQPAARPRPRERQR